MRRISCPDPAVALRQPLVLLPDGRSISAGQELRISGERGVFRFEYAWAPDGSLAVYGPLDDQHACWRSFSAARVRSLCRKPRSRSARLAVEA